MNNVAAVVVTYNRRQLLNENLTCLLAQSRPVDIIVIDNASTDGTFESLGELIDSGRINYYNTGSNLGGAGGFFWCPQTMKKRRHFPPLPRVGCRSDKERKVRRHGR